MKKVKKAYKKLIEYIITNRLFLSYVVLSLIATIIVRRLTIGSSPNLYASMTDLGIIILIGALGYFIKPKKQFRYYFLWLCFFCLLGIINSIYYVFYNNFASAGDLATLSQAETVTGSILDRLNPVLIVFILIPILFYVIHRKLSYSSYYAFIDKIERGKIMALGTSIVAIALIAISFLNATGTDYSRLKKQWYRQSIVERFGILLYHGNDLVQTLKPKISSLFGYEDALELFNNFYNSEDRNLYKEDNKYTGILEGKNIVFVHMEGMQTFLMNLKFNGGEVTPYLNALANEGMFFPHFYPQISTGTSSDTEFTMSSSLMPAVSGTVFINYYRNNYNTTMKILGAKGYYTYSMHGNAATMWGRNKAHPSLGYQGLYFEENFDYTEDDVINLGINDKLFFKQAIPIMENIEENYPNYMAEVITLSNHSPFTFVDKYGEFDLSETTTVLNEQTGEYEQITTDFLEGTPVGNYIHSAHYADEALGDFISYIKNSDYFDDTIFVFYGDHDAKLTRKELNYLYNHKITDGELYEEDDEEYTPYDSYDHSLNKNTPLIIWTKNPELKNVFTGTVNYYMGMLDLQPTILNMFGLKNEYALGHDIFNIKDDNIIPFPDGSFLTNALYYNNSVEEFKPINTDIVIDDDYISSRKAYVDNLLEVSNSIIVYNLLDKKEATSE